MTKVGRLFEEEKLEYAQKREQETRQETRQETKKEIARKMLFKGVDILAIMEFTSLSKDEVLKLKAEISA